MIASSANVALDPTRLLIMPGTVNIVALGGDVDAIGTMDLWPAADGNLNLLARGGVNLANIVMSDTDPINSLPTPASPKGSLQVFGLLALDQTNNLQPGLLRAAAGAWRRLCRRRAGRQCAGARRGPGW